MSRSSNASERSRRSVACRPHRSRSPGFCKPGVTAPIVGATKVEHVEDALAGEALSLSEDEIERLEAVYVPHPVAGIEL